MTTLSELLGLAPDASPDDVDSRVAARLLEHGCARPEPGADPDDPRVGLWWLLRMAARTHRRHVEGLPPVDAELLARFEDRLKTRPARAEEHGQLHIDPASTLRRARVIAERLAKAPGPVIAVGDDDAVTVALSLLGVGEVHAVDIDPRVLAYLHDATRGFVRVHEADVLGGSVPEPLRSRFSVAVTDPFRDLDGLGFLTFAAACLRRDSSSRLLWVDHPDWNFEHEEMQRTLQRLGWHLEETHPELHAYPLSAEAVRLQELQAAWNLDPAWLTRLVQETSGWSHLHVLAPRSTRSSAPEEE